MESVHQLNGLNGLIVNRKTLMKLQALALREEQNHVSNKIVTVLRETDFEQYEIKISERVTEVVPESFLQYIDYEHFTDKKYTGLNKAVSSNDIYDMITNKMIEKINEANLPNYQTKWKQINEKGGYSIPFNFVSRKSYRSVNFLLLTINGLLENPFFLTFKQIESLGGTIKKGAKGNHVVYYTKLFTLKNSEKKVDFASYKFDEVQTVATENQLDKNQIGTVPILKYYNVFNGADVDGIDFDLDSFKVGYKTADSVENKERLEICDLIVKNYPAFAPKIIHEGNQAFYRPSTDTVTMPPINAFETTEDYYRTLFHELAHSTGSFNRLNRDFTGRFGDKKYAFEELIAEFGSVFLSAEAGLIWYNNSNHAAYLKSWNRSLVHLKADNKFLFRASTQAQKLADFVLQPDAKGQPLFYKDLKKNEVKPVKKTPVKKTTLAREYEQIKAKYPDAVLLYAVKDYYESFDADAIRVSKILGINLHQRKLLDGSVQSFAGFKKFYKNIYLAKLVNAGVRVAIAENLDDDEVESLSITKKTKSINAVKKIPVKKTPVKKTPVKKTPVKKTPVKAKFLDIDEDFVEAKQIDTTDNIEVSRFLDEIKKNDAWVYQMLKIKVERNNLTLSDIAKIQTICKTKNNYKPEFILELANKIQREDKTEKNSGLNAVETKQTNAYSTAYGQQKSPKTKNETYKIVGDLSKFLGKIEIKPVHSLAITLDSAEGGGKTHTVFQWANEFSKAGYKPIIWSLEEHKTSQLSIDKAQKYFTGNAIKTIAVESENDGETKQQTFNRIQQSCSDFDVVIIDSWAKLVELNSKVSFDLDFRKKFNGKLFIVIFQRTSSGAMRGGTKSGFDGDIILKVDVNRDDFRKNFVYNHKNRYNAHAPISELKYSPALRKLILVGKKNSVEPQTKKLVFKEI